MSKEPWWPPRKIVFSWEQVEWLLSHYPILRDGNWPPDPKLTGYSEVRGVVKIRKERRKHWAYFETPVEVAAELGERMKLVGENSSILRDIYILGMTMDEAADLRRLTYEQLRGRRNRAMKIMTGVKRKVPQIGVK